MNGKKLIINADDFGLTQSCTEAIVEAFRKNYITDTTMLANGEAFDLAVKYAVAEFNGKVGIHFNLTEAKPLTESIASFSEFCENGVFHRHINRYKPLSAEAKKAVYEELSTQANKIQAAGINISHADSHHHIHTSPFIAPIVFRVCREHGIRKIRLHRNIGAIAGYKMLLKKAYNKKLRKQFATTDYFGGMEDAKVGLPDGVIEIMVHPDYDNGENLIDREGEERTGTPLSDIEKIIEGNILTSYKELTK